jgi:hypothetical protein
MPLTCSNLEQIQPSINYQIIFDHVGHILADEKNIQFLTSDEQKLEFVKKFFVTESFH